MIPEISSQRLQRQIERFKEDVELEFKIQKINLNIKEVEPTTKSIVCQGLYTDYLLAKQICEKKGWNIQQDSQ